MPPLSRITLPFVLILIFLSAATPASAQDDVIRGIVTDTAGFALPDVHVFIIGDSTGTVSGTDGRFSLNVPAGNKSPDIVFSCIGYRADTLHIRPGEATGALTVILSNETIGIEDVRVMARRTDNITSVTIPAVAGLVIPSVTGGIETAIASLPGVASFSELSHNYSVRGGSYDENLVYINDIEVYRPYLIRSGQQEGLSSINPDLTASVSFSPGGFSAAYGDRMSSVLDIKYREPGKTEGSASLSLLTSSIHAGARSGNDKFFFIAGARYRSNALLLGSFDTKGQYSPAFADIQAMAGYSPAERTKITVSLWASSNRYNFIPQSQTTKFGTVEQAYKLYAWFEGGERDRYDNGGGAVTLDLSHGDKITSKFILSGYLARENESFDIRGAYSLSSLDKNEGSENNPDTLLNAGIGSWLTHARNRLHSGQACLSYRGSLSAGRSRFEWGLTGKYRDDDITTDEWLRVDSAGYTLGTTGDELNLTSFTDRADNVTSYTTEAWLISKNNFTVSGIPCNLNTGIRTAYSTYNREFLVSPRIAFTVTPSQHMTAWIAAGAYHQPPGGREMMFLAEDTVLKAQRSFHLTAGTGYDFTAWDRPFRFTAEIYGKLFSNLIPYKTDNVRLLYYGGNIAGGYSAGLDLRVNGEFVRGVESWFSLSVMKSEMKIPSYNSGWFPAPFDQRVNFSVFFQDYLPGHPDFRAHINIEIGTGIPASPPGKDQWNVWFRMPPYRRVDIGFSKILAGDGDPERKSFLKELSAGLELFNLADIRNTISYTWIRTVMNSEGQSREFAVPSYLTGRSLNLRLTARF
jgi:hypothetical protein